MAQECCRHSVLPPRTTESAYRRASRLGARKAAAISALRFYPRLRITGCMLAKVFSAAVNGIEAYPVEVEVNAGFGDTLIVIVESV